MEEQRMRRNRGMTSKNQKRTQNKYSLRDEPILQPLRMLSTQNKYSLRDEPILQPLRMLTTEDHSHSARGQFDMTNCWDTNMSDYSLNISFTIVDSSVILLSHCFTLLLVLIILYRDGN
ncbi:hypothetical protein ACS0TY_026500 [Phlomoides rotata]